MGDGGDGGIEELLEGGSGLLVGGGELCGGTEGEEDGGCGEGIAVVQVGHCVMPFKVGAASLKPGWGWPGGADLWLEAAGRVELELGLSPDRRMSRGISLG